MSSKRKSSSSSRSYNLLSTRTSNNSTRGNLASNNSTRGNLTSNNSTRSTSASNNSNSNKRKKLSTINVEEDELDNNSTHSTSASNNFNSKRKLSTINVEEDELDNEEEQLDDYNHDYYDNMNINEDNRSDEYKRLENLAIAIDNKVESLSSRFDEFLESFTLLSEQLNNNKTDNHTTDLVNEDLKKTLKDSIRRNLFIYDKYPTDLKIEKYCRETLTKTHPQNKHYTDRQLWDNVWFKLRQPALEMVRVMRGNSVFRIKNALYNKFEDLEKISNDDPIDEIIRWKNSETTKAALAILEEIEPEDDQTYLENITRDAFRRDRGLSKGSNKIFTWAVINAFLGSQNPNLHLDEKVIKSLMEEYKNRNND